MHDVHSPSPTIVFAPSGVAPDTVHHTPVNVFRSVGWPRYDTLMAD